MCGIAGYKTFGKDKPKKSEVEALLIGIMSRGKDATGVAWVDKNLYVVKDGVTAEDFIKLKEWKSLELPDTMILHTRQGTGGTAKENVNNHPIFNKDGMALIHNGVLTNEKFLYNKYKITPDGEVDSEIILRLIEKKGWGDIENLNELAGNYACAVLWAKKPNELILFRHGNPISYFMDKKRDILFFASTGKIIKSAICSTYRGFRTGSITCHDMQDDCAMLINKDSICDLKEIVPIKTQYQSSYCGGYGGYDGLGCHGDKYNDWRKEHPATTWKDDLEKRKERLKLVDDKGTAKTFEYGSCISCRAYGVVSREKEGNICKDCKDLYLGRHYTCPWCMEDISLYDTEIGKCPACLNKITMPDAN